MKPDPANGTVVSKPWKPGRKTVELNAPVRPSRIRRDPVRPDQRDKKVEWRSRESEIGLALAGIIFFALAITALIIDIGEMLSH